MLIWLFSIWLLLLEGLAVAFAESVVEPDVGKLPGSVKQHYRDQDAVYWQVTQIVMSPLFDHAETTAAEFFAERTGRLFVIMPDKQIYLHSDTIWVYVPEYRQIQRQRNVYVLNPFSFLDTSQPAYMVSAFSDRTLALKRLDEVIEPESLKVHYAADGRLESIEYDNLNGDKVTLLLRKEGLGRRIPRDNFVQRPPKGVEIIDLDQ